MNDAPQDGTPRGLARDFQRAREGTKASAEELREFVRRFRGKSPHEMLGLVTGSGLIQSTVMATAIVAGVLLLFTVWPYFDSQRNATAQAPSTAAAPAAAPAASPSATAAAAPAAAPTATKPAATGPAAPPASPPNAAPPDPLLDRLGIGETKAADPKKNPLEAGADDLLKDLK